jgi:hypothetical protein
MTQLRDYYCIKCQRVTSHEISRHDNADHARCSFCKHTRVVNVTIKEKAEEK